MNKFLKKGILLLAIAGLLAVACNDDEPGDNSAGYEKLIQHLSLTNQTPEQVLNNAGELPLFMQAQANGDVSDKWILDIRNASDFVSGHIEGANSAGFKDILTIVNAADKPVLVVDYTGEVAGYVATLLRLYGYPDAQALKWGMSGWNNDFDIWTANINDFTNHENWTQESFEPGSFNPPSFRVKTSDGAAMLQERVEAVFSSGYKGVEPSTIMDNPQGYFINFYMPLDDYLGFGHMNGAVQVYPLEMANFDRLNPQQKMAVCSYSGQISGAVAAYLNVLGFDAFNLKYGLNGLAHSSSFWDESDAAEKWGENAVPKNLPYVSGNN